MAKLSVKNGDFSLFRFVTAGFDLFLARKDGRKENRETIGKRYTTSNAMLNKFADFMAEYFSDKGIENGGAVTSEDMDCIVAKAQEFIDDEKRRNKGRKVWERYLNSAKQLKEMGYSDDDLRNNLVF